MCVYAVTLLMLYRRSWCEIWVFYIAVAAAVTAAIVPVTTVTASAAVITYSEAAGGGGSGSPLLPPFPGFKYQWWVELSM